MSNPWMSSRKPRGVRLTRAPPSDGVVPRPSRRTFVKGLAIGGAVAGLGVWRPSAWASTDVGRQPTVLSGTDFDLTIGETLMNFTGSPRFAVTVNGAIPAPTLRWREGDTVTLRVANTLREDTSIHWHGILLPANMGRRAGAELQRRAAGRDPHIPVHGSAGRNLLVSQPLWVSGTAGDVRRAHRRTPRTRALQLRPRPRCDAVRLDGRKPRIGCSRSLRSKRTTTTSAGERSLISCGRSAREGLDQPCPTAALGARCG